MRDLTPLKNEPPAELDALDLRFQTVAAEKARIVAEEDACKPGQLLPKNVLEVRYQKQFEQEFYSFRKRLKNGASKIAVSLQALSTENPEMFSKEVTDTFYAIAELPETIEKDEYAFREAASRGVTLQELAHVSDETIDKLYQGAKRLYEQALYEDACDAFLFLTNINANKYAFWLGLANAHFSLKRYDEALYAYSKACNTNPSDPNNYLLLSRCYVARGEIDSAIQILDLALLSLEGKTEFTDWNSRLKAEKTHFLAMQHR